MATVEQRRLDFYLPWLLHRSNKCKYSCPSSWQVLSHMRRSCGTAGECKMLLNKLLCDRSRGQQFCSCWALLHTHCSWSSSLGEKSWLAHLLFKPVTYTRPLSSKDCHPKPVKFSMSFQRDRQRETHWLIDWLRFSGRGKDVGWKILLSKNHIPPPFLMYPQIKLSMVQKATSSNS